MSGDMSEQLRIMIMALGFLLGLMYVLMLRTSHAEHQTDGADVDNKIDDLLMQVPSSVLSGAFIGLMGIRMLWALAFVWGSRLVLNGSMWAYLPLALIATDVSVYARITSYGVAYIRRAKLASNEGAGAIINGVLLY